MKLSPKQRHWLMGGVLLLSVAAAAAVSRQDDSDTDTVQPVRHRSAPQAPVAEAGNPAPAGADMAFSIDTLKRPMMAEHVKDMFESHNWYVPPPPPKVKPRPSAPPLNFVYIGKMQDTKDHYTVFLERQGRVYIVHAGDRIDVNYRVDDIGGSLLTMTYVPLDIKQTLPIGELN